MKIFETIQTYYAILGICSTDQRTQQYPFSERIFFGFLLCGCNIISQFVYTSHVANGFIEYIECICSAFGAIIVFVCFATIFAKRTILFKTIDRIEQLIGTSKTMTYDFLR